MEREKIKNELNNNNNKNRITIKKSDFFDSYFSFTKENLQFLTFKFL